MLDNDNTIIDDEIDIKKNNYTNLTPKKRHKFVKILRKHTIERFQYGVEAIQNNNITENDLILLNEFEPSILKTIVNLQKEKKEKENREKYIDPILYQKNDIFDDLIFKAKKYAEVVAEEKRKLTLIEVNIPNELENKENTLNDYELRINKAYSAINSLKSAREESFPKRKVGRPKKEQLPVNTELLKSISTLDEQISKLVAQLNAEQKKHIIDYIEKMLKVEQDFKRIYTEGGD